MVESLTFSYTGAMQEWLVPSGVTTVTIECWGAEGGRAVSSAPRRYGGYAKGNLLVTPGEKLAIYVGGSPAIGVRAGGWNGGGNGGLQENNSDFNGSGGGGGSDVRYSPGLDPSWLWWDDIRIAAGGAGGTSSKQYYTAGEAGGFAGWVPLRRGGHGGAATGEAGEGSAEWEGGFGGTQSNGGSYRGGMLSGGWANGGVHDSNGDAIGSGGGGGGGYFGGGGGDSGANFLSSAQNGIGGGGGSNYVGGVTSSTSTRGVRAGHGQVILQWEPPNRSIFSLFSGLKAPIYGGDGKGVTIYLPNGKRL